MNYKVVYFSRTGISAKVAKKIGEKLNCDIIEITDDVNWKGPVGFVKGGKYAMQDKPVNITVHGNIDQSDELIVVSPVWANHVAPAITAFQKTRNLKNIHLVTTSNATKIPDMSAYKTAHAIIKKEKNEETVIAELVSLLKSQLQ